MPDSKQAVAEEFFYLDDDGTKQDADLHNGILGPVDHPIDEKVMAPIRARYRADHVAKQKVKSRAIRWIKVKTRAEEHLANGQNDLYRRGHGTDDPRHRPEDDAARGRRTGGVRPSAPGAAEDRPAGDEESSAGLAGRDAGDPERFRAVGWNESEHPRHPAGSAQGGEFVGDGAGSEGSAKPDAQNVDTAANAKGSPRSFDRESATEAQRERGVVSIYRPTAAAAAEMKANGQTPLTFYEHGSAKGAETFRNAIQRAKASSKFGAAVTVYDADDYKAMRLFTTPDGLSGFALKGDDIVSLFKHDDSKAARFGTTSLKLATEQGGRRLDAFDTMLPDLYSASGFKAVARLKWSDQYAPDGWDKATFATFNNGEPDVVFMVHSPATAKPYVKGDGRTVSDYDEGTAEQMKSAPSIPGYQPGVRGRGDVEVKTRRAQWVAQSNIKTINDVIRAAPIAQKTFAESGRRIATEMGIEFKDPGPKTSSAKGIDRTIQKIAERAPEPAARVTDTARGAFVLNSPEQADAVIAKLSITHEVLAEPWRTVPGMNYTDRALLFRDRQTGLIGEVQLIEPKMLAAKTKGGGHEMYEAARVMPKGPERAALESKMEALYGGVLDSYKGTPWEAVDGRNRFTNP